MFYGIAAILSAIFLSSIWANPIPMSYNSNDSADLCQYFDYNNVTCCNDVLFYDPSGSTFCFKNVVFDKKSYQQIDLSIQQGRVINVTEIVLQAISMMHRDGKMPIRSRDNSAKSLVRQIMQHPTTSGLVYETMRGQISKLPPIQSSLAATYENLQKLGPVGEAYMKVMGLGNPENTESDGDDYEVQNSIDFLPTVQSVPDRPYLIKPSIDSQVIFSPSEAVYGSDDLYANYDDYGMGRGGIIEAIPVDDGTAEEGFYALEKPASEYPQSYNIQTSWNQQQERTLVSPSFYYQPPQQVKPPPPPQQTQRETAPTLSIYLDRRFNQAQPQRFQRAPQQVYQPAVPIYQRPSVPVRPPAPARRQTPNVRRANVVGHLSGRDNHMYWTRELRSRPTFGFTLMG